MSEEGRHEADRRAERRALDHYVTPSWCADRFLEKFSVPASRILDPCAARGELITAAQPYFPFAQFAACELNDEYEADLREPTEGAVVIGDFLERFPLFKKVGIDLVLTNPPYAKAEEFIRASLEVAPVVAMLLRINFLASQKRRDWLHQQRPGIFVLPNRPSFTGEGGDQTEYAWFTFGHRESAGQIDWLELTPPEVIKAANDRARLIHAPASSVVRVDKAQDGRGVA